MTWLSGHWIFRHSRHDWEGEDKKEGIKKEGKDRMKKEVLVKVYITNKHEKQV